MLVIAFICALASIFGKLAWQTTILVTIACVIFDLFVGRFWYPGSPWRRG